MIWRAHEREWNLRQRALIMGILNVTPDSFSDGGCYLDVDRAVDHALEMERQGADIIDIGGESTRPGANPVNTEEELRRVVPVIEKLRARSNVAISIDSSKASVAGAAIKAGANIVNDVTALRGDALMAKIVADSGSGLVLMHMRGRPRDMQRDPVYVDVVAEVASFLREQAEFAEDSGVARERMVFDPGIGFGKTLEHNLALLRNPMACSIRERPVLLGVSRKSFLGRILGTDRVEDRDWASVALTSLAIERGVRILRVHDVKRHVEAARMTEAILAAGYSGQ